MDTKPNPKLDRQIGALLDRVGQSQSIVDSLMALPLPAGEDGALTEWDLAVLRRLESRLSASMRSVLEGEPERKRA